jgi:hypothetical protein
MVMRQQRLTLFLEAACLACVLSRTVCSLAGLSFAVQSWQLYSTSGTVACSTICRLDWPGAHSVLIASMLLLPPLLPLLLLLPPGP